MDLVEDGDDEEELAEYSFVNEDDDENENSYHLTIETDGFDDFDDNKENLTSHEFNEEPQITEPHKLKSHGRRYSSPVVVVSSQSATNEKKFTTPSPPSTALQTQKTEKTQFKNLTKEEQLKLAEKEVRELRYKMSSQKEETQNY